MHSSSFFRQLKSQFQNIEYIIEFCIKILIFTIHLGVVLIFDQIIFF